MRQLVTAQRIGLLVGAVAVTIAGVLYLTPVGSAPSSNEPGASMTFCGSVVVMEHDAGHCGTALATRRAWATMFLAGGAVAGTAAVWAFRPRSGPE
ncbi:MAG: hypothetical protein OES13_02545 [Acidimicrobiia bacterium]|nr:hypothetical protein [Acidimicrobiia bacterium]